MFTDQVTRDCFSNVQEPEKESATAKLTTMLPMFQLVNLKETRYSNDFFFALPPSGAESIFSFTQLNFIANFQLGRPPQMETSQPKNI